MAMSRDGRGNPGRQIPQHPAPRLKLSDLLRRRKMTLKQMLAEHGITAYETLVIRCNRMGVQPPTLAEFRVVMPEAVNSAQEGVVVLDPPKVVDEISGRPIDPEAPVEQPGIVVLTDRPYEPFKPPFPESVKAPMEDTVRPSKKLHKKKEDQSPEQD
jgi:hypothetical protein